MPATTTPATGRTSAATVLPRVRLVNPHTTTTVNGTVVTWDAVDPTRGNAVYAQVAFHAHLGQFGRWVAVRQLPYSYPYTNAVVWGHDVVYVLQGVYKDNTGNAHRPSYLRTTPVGTAVYNRNTGMAGSVVGRCEDGSGVYVAWEDETLYPEELHTLVYA